MEDYGDYNTWESREEDYNEYENEQVFRDLVYELYDPFDEEPIMNTPTVVWLAVVTNNPSLSNAFTTRDEAVSWIESYLENGYYTLSDQYWMSSTGAVLAWCVSREVTL